MKRHDFIKSSIITGTGLMAGLINPLKATSNFRSVRIDLPFLVRQSFRAIAMQSNRPYENCYCDGTSCYKNNVSANDYYSQSNIWNIIRDSRFLYHQRIRDRYNDDYIINASVPFFASGNLPIMKIEGPSLYGLCKALQQYNLSADKNYSAKDIFVPSNEISNAGYRFDTEPCNETSYDTNKGKTTISYDKPRSKVRVVAEGNEPRGILYHDQTYTV